MSDAFSLGHMRRASFILSVFCIGLFSLIATPLAFAQAREPLVVSLEAYKVTPASQNAGETFAKADTAQPGDVIEYRATYSNTTQRALSGLSLDIPIPPSLTWMPGAAATTDGKAPSPAPGLASLDGKNYIALPLGAATAPGLVRAVRWDISGIAPRAVIVLAVRARVNAEPATPAAPQSAR